ncbi:MAG: hypothetical protein F9K29_03395 [Hyphomicrobiaceae bacterium]|nr:MAG: hypothetical protein F9K29_03395 [Hyphomicrobiaceae bacterium]
MGKIYHCVLAVAMLQTFASHTAAQTPPHHRMRELWNEFQRFKAQPAFRELGFSREPYGRWRAAVAELRDHPTYGKQLLIICGVAPSELIEIAHDYSSMGADATTRSKEAAFAACFRR